jgi:tRNA (cmo5U34)-methyltransferase
VDDRMGAVRVHFEGEAFEYDALIPKLIPHYMEQHQVMMRLAKILVPEGAISALDLGCGTGVLAYQVLQAFPEANVLLLDVAESMLDAARRNLAAFPGRVASRCADFVGADLSRGDGAPGYDLVVSGLSLHHLEGDDLRAFYARLHSAMRPGGAFLNRDIVANGDPAVRGLHERLWREYIRAGGEDEASWFAKYQLEDRPTPVAKHLEWLAEAGFENAACHWQYLNFAIVGATA